MTEPPDRRPAADRPSARTGDEAALADADAVFVGSLVNRVVEGGAMRSTAHTAVHRFDVRAVYKGEVRQGQEVVSTADGSSCGLHAPPGVDVLVFADRTSHLGPQPGAGQLAGDLCNGTRPLELRPVPASFGAPTQPPQPSLETPAGVDEEDGSTSRRVLIGATGAAVAALAVVLARRCRARRGAR